MLLRLKDDIDTVDFAAAGEDEYFLIEGSFSAPPPAPVDVRMASGKLISRTYASRTVRFSYKVVGADTRAVIAAIGKVFRMLYRASTPTYASGDTYTQATDLGESSTTGDGGCVLQVRWDTAGSTETAYPESDYQSTTAMSRIYNFNVISGSQNIPSPFSVESQILNSSSPFVLQVDVELECKPFALGPSRVVRPKGAAAAPTLDHIPTAVDRTLKHKLIIPAADIPGDVPALTRISTTLNQATGIAIGRHAGDCLVNCPSYPTLVSGVNDDIVVFGYSESETETIYNVKVTAIAAGGDTVQYNTNGGAFGNATVIENHKPIQIGSTGIYFMFLNKTGHAVNNEWSFRSSQVYIIPSGGSFGVHNGSGNEAAFLGWDGKLGATVDFNIPSNARGRYKMLAHVTATGGALIPEFQIRMFYRGLPITLGDPLVDTEEAIFDWVRTTGKTYQVVDLGTLDLSAESSPQLSHPGAVTRARGQIYARGTVLDDPGPFNINITRFALVPVQDNDAYLYAGWVYDGFGREVYCNYDYENPYMVEVSANALDVDAGHTAYDDAVDVDLTAVTATALDGTHVGKVPTLIPGVANTLVIIPLKPPLAAGTDFREFGFDNSSDTGPISVAIKPRYLFVG